MADIIKEIVALLPQGKISDAAFEGANIVLYTKDERFFLNNEGNIKRVVDEFKKRIDLRPDPSITMDMEEAEKDQTTDTFIVEDNFGGLRLARQENGVYLYDTSRDDPYDPETKEGIPDVDNPPPPSTVREGTGDSFIPEAPEAAP